MEIDPTQNKASIVLVGSFNPAIFHPSWLALNSLISKEQAQQAELRIAHPDLSQFVAGYMTFEIRKDRFLVMCDSHIQDIIKDLVLGAFRDLLPHTPVWHLGINRSITFSCGTEERRNKFGEMLAPRDPWGDWGIEIGKSQGPKEVHGGMIRLIMRQQPRSDGIEGHLQADVRPDQNNDSDVVVDVNNHIIAGKPDEVEGCIFATELLEDRWDAAMSDAERVVSCLMKTVNEMQ